MVTIHCALTGSTALTSVMMKEVLEAHFRDISLEESLFKPNGINSPSRSELLHFINSAKSTK